MERDNVKRCVYMCEQERGRAKNKGRWKGKGRREIVRVEDSVMDGKVGARRES